SRRGRRWSRRPSTGGDARRGRPGRTAQSAVSVLGFMRRLTATAEGRRATMVSRHFAGPREISGCEPMADKAGRGDGQRLERKINEILNKIEQFPNAESRRSRARKRALRRLGNAIAERQRLAMRYLSRISVSQVMLVAFLMILGAFF